MMRVCSRHATKTIIPVCRPRSSCHFVSVSPDLAARIGIGRTRARARSNFAKLCWQASCTRRRLWFQGAVRKDILQFLSRSPKCKASEGVTAICLALVCRIGKSGSELLTPHLLRKLRLNRILPPLLGGGNAWLKKAPQTERAIDVGSGE